MQQKHLKYFTVVSFLIFLLLLLPLFYLSYVNRATGDDYGYGVYTRTAWVSTHSLTAVAQAAWQTVREFYYSWQGTWFSIFIFSLQPEVFHDNAYITVAFLMLFLWIGSTVYLFRQILYSRMKMNKWAYLLITIWFLIISIEFIPSPKSSIFWFNGCAHYMLPFAMCQMTAAWLLKYSKTYKIYPFTGIIIFMTLLGGSNYQAALLALIVACYVGIADWFLKKDRRIFALLIPIFTELVSLAVSMKAPGNWIRTEGDFGFSFSKALETIGLSFWYGIKDMGTYWRERPLIYAGLLFLFLLFATIFYTGTEFHFRHPIWLSLMLFCLYSAMQAPAIYAGVEVSRGVPNTNYQTFLLTASGILLIIAEKFAGILKTKTFQRIVTLGLLLCLFWVILFKGNIKDSTSYVSLAYITSGQASDYKEQMDLQTKLMEDDSKNDVIVPGINDVQGPLMHMPITADRNKFTNWATAQFYGKNSVVSIDRAKWIEEYGNPAGN